MIIVLGMLKAFLKKNPYKKKLYTPQKALSILVMAQLSKFQYSTIRNEAIKCGNNVWPSYNTLLVEKSNCYPHKNKIEITEMYAKVDLQALLDHTVSRIIKGVQTLNDSVDTANLVLICKWGCDGASGQSRYKQIAHKDADINDDTVFISSVVPLRLENEIDLTIVWENSTPSSPWFCRPIQF